MCRFAQPALVLAFALFSTATLPAAAQVIPLTGDSSSTDFTNGAPLEDLDGGPSMTFTRHGITVTVRAVGGVIDCSSNGVGVSATDTQAGANIDSEEAIIITFGQVTRWIYLSVATPGAAAPSSEPVQLCARVTYSAVSGYSTDMACRGSFGGRIDPPESAQPVVIDMSDEQFVSVSRGEGSPFVVDSIYVTPGDGSDPERGVANLYFLVSGPSELRLAAGEAPGMGMITVGNDGPDNASGLIVDITCTGCEILSATPPEGTMFDLANGRWDIGNLATDAILPAIELSLRALPGSGESARLAASVAALDQVNNGDSPEFADIPIRRSDDELPAVNPLEAIFAVFFGGCGNGSLAALMCTTAGVGVMRVRRGGRACSRRW